MNIYVYLYVQYNFLTNSEIGKQVCGTVSNFLADKAGTVPL